MMACTNLIKPIQIPNENFNDGQPILEHLTRGDVKQIANNRSKVTRSNQREQSQKQNRCTLLIKSEKYRVVSLQIKLNPL